MLFVVAHIMCSSSSFVEAVESVAVEAVVVEAVESVFFEAVDCWKLLCVLKSSSFVEAVESVVEAVDCCKLLCALESSNFVEAVESVVVEALESVVAKAVDCCSLLCALVLLKLLNLLLKLLIVVCVIESSRFVDSVVVADVDCGRLHCLL